MIREAEDVIILPFSFRVGLATRTEAPTIKGASKRGIHFSWIAYASRLGSWQYASLRPHGCGAALGKVIPSLRTKSLGALHQSRRLRCGHTRRILLMGSNS